MDYHEFFQAIRKLNPSLSPDQRATLIALLDNPAGDVELTDEDLGSVAGGAAPSTEMEPLCLTCADPCKIE